MAEKADLKPGTSCSEIANIGYYTNPDCPVLRMWKVVLITLIEWWLKEIPKLLKVDIEGNQLPYIDKVIIDIVSNEEGR